MVVFSAALSANKGYLDLNGVKSGQLDQATSGALRKFQEDVDLARTGNPDHETVRSRIILGRA